MSKFAQILKRCDDAPRLFIFFIFFGPILIMVPVVIWAEACPFWPPAQPSPLTPQG